MTARKRTTAKAKQEAEAKAAEATEQATPAAAEPAPVLETATAMAPDIEPVPPATTDAVAIDASTSPETPTEIPGNELTGDGTGHALPPIDTEEVPGLFVRTKRRIKSRRRAGHRFNREGTGIALELLTDEQIEQLRSDPALEVEDCTFPIAGATQEPEI
ncbi:hypothetical protein RN346_04525 [Halomonas sp. PAMB 3232]|uniref:hypothetical protein n=1 Tax=Halomonas sp. PAMB 3232 TaxID=3075221 RepID=UPI00289B0DD9|nr:hypothetical protein [Halomonas sp. PAMB 3232]WNL39827.1 hypothetical protein RN346_04525 [Halomonas sp. PAMB 3232]